MHCLLLLLRLLLLPREGGVMQVDFDIPLFGRESEQEALLKRLMARPYTIWLILGPQSSGKTCLLRELLLERKPNAPVWWIGGRSQNRAESHVMFQVLDVPGAGCSRCKSMP